MRSEQTDPQAVFDGTEEMAEPKEGWWARRKKAKAEAKREQILLERADAAMVVVTTLFDVDERKRKVHAKKKFISFDDVEVAVRRAIASKLD